MYIYIHIHIYIYMHIYIYNIDIYIYIIYLLRLNEVTTFGLHETRGAEKGKGGWVVRVGEGASPYR